MERSEANPCPSCGEHVPPEVWACPRCGAEVSQPPQEAQDSYAGGSCEASEGVGQPPEEALEQSGGQEPQEWQTVFVGYQPEALVIQMVLEGRGIRTFVPDSMTKTIDPFITGGNALAVRLQVPAADAQRALQAIDESRAKSGPRPSGESDADGDQDQNSAEDQGQDRDDDMDDREEANGEVPDEEDRDGEAPAVQAEPVNLDTLGRRVRWASALIITAPWGLVLGLEYIIRSRREKTKPVSHCLTVAATALAAVELAVGVWLVLRLRGCLSVL